MADPKAKVRIVGQNELGPAFNRALGDANKFAGRLSGLFKGAIAAGGFGLLAKQAASFSMGIVEASDKVKLLSARLETFSGDAAAFSKAYAAAQQLGVAVEDVAGGMARFLVVGRDLGVTADDAQRLTITFQQLAKLGGATGQEASAAFIQLTQALGAGVLRGQELNSILEQAPLVAQAIADRLGVGIGQLKKLGEQGKISAQIVKDALTAAADEANARFGQLPQTLEQSKSRVKNAWDTLLAELDQQTAQSSWWKRLSDGLVETFENLSGELAGDNTALGRISQDIERVDRILAMNAGASEEFIAKYKAERETLQGLWDEAIQSLESTQDYLVEQDRIQTTIRIEAAASVKEYEALEKQIEAAKKELEQFYELVIRGNDAGTGGLAPLQFSEMQLGQDINKALAGVKMEDLAVPQITDDFQNQFGEITEFGIQAARNIQSAFADFLFDPFKDGLKGMLKGFLDTIRRMVAEIAAQQLLNSFFGGLAGSSNSIVSGIGSFFGGGKAVGGPVEAGKAYLVGEKGPELLLTGPSSGTIVPNHRLPRSAPVINVSPVYNIDARGATQDLAKQLPGILAAHARQTVEMARKAINEDVSRGAFGRA